MQPKLFCNVNMLPLFVLIAEQRLIANLRAVQYMHSPTSKPLSSKQLPWQLLMPCTGRLVVPTTCSLKVNTQPAVADVGLAVQHTKEWWLGACLSTAIPVIYSFTGGMRASLVTDVAQSVVCIGFLIALIIVLGVNAPASFGSWNPAGMQAAFHLARPCHTNLSNQFLVCVFEC